MNNGTLIADSGSTKTDWALGTQRVKTQGINPFHQSKDVIFRILREELLTEIDDRRVNTVEFYGSGVRPELQPLMVALLKETFPLAVRVEAHSDLFGAAKALCGTHEGIACILGTGSNSCLYNGREIVGNTPPMGYILGDEGGGAVLGKRFITSLYKKWPDTTLKVAFEKWAGVDLAAVIDRVYRQPLANRWLASLSVFIHEQLADERVETLVVDNFRDFILLNINPYQRRDLPLSAVGSMAFYYREQWEKAAKAEGYVLGSVMQSPIEGLIKME